MALMTQEIGGHGITSSTCAYWQIRRCNRDPFMFLHRTAPPPTSTCKYWMNGNCKFGDQCRSLHSWSDVEPTFVGMQHVFLEDSPRPTRLVWWTPPPRGFFKLNCDGAFTVYGNKGAAGGVLRDWKGEFILGFSDALIECSSALEAELWAIKIGMQTAVARGYRNLIVESDSLKAIQIINADKGAFLRSSIQHMTRMVDRICWNHVYRETNSVADGFAKHGLSLSQDQSIRVFESAPDFIESRLYGDRIGKIYCR